MFAQPQSGIEAPPASDYQESGIQRLLAKRSTARRAAVRDTLFGFAYEVQELRGGLKTTLRPMTIQRMDNVGVVVDDLEAAVAFFLELGLELDGEAVVEGRWVDRVVGLDDVRADIAMVRTPDGHGRLELTKFHMPTAVSTGQNEPANTLGIRRIMFAVDDIEDVLGRLQAHGAEVVGELQQYEDFYRLCYVRGPEGILIALAEQLS